MPAPRGTRVALAIAGIVARAYSLWAIVGAGREAVLWGGALLLLGAPMSPLLATGRPSTPPPPPPPPPSTC